MQHSLPLEVEEQKKQYSTGDSTALLYGVQKQETKKNEGPHLSPEKQDPKTNRQQQLEKK
ncbi:hypothetical protein AVEN_175586-1, partial [Araneus ventricosus]